MNDEEEEDLHPECECEYWHVAGCHQLDEDDL